MLEGTVPSSLANLRNLQNLVMGRQVEVNKRPNQDDG